MAFSNQVQRPPPLSSRISCARSHSASALLNCLRFVTAKGLGR